MDYDYLFKLKEHYTNSNISAESREDIVAELQSTMQAEIDSNLISEYDLRIGMPEYRRMVKVNYTKEIPVAIKDERFKEPVYDALAISIYTAPNECDSGDYIAMTIRDIEELFLVRAEPNKRRNHDKLMLLHCQYNVTILDDNGIDTHVYGLFMQDNKSRPAISERAETGVTENSTFQAYIKHDAISRRFIEATGTKVNGQPNKIQRILIDGLAYKIVGSDPISARGLITLGLELDIKEPSDNLELGIANYWDNIAPEEPEPTLQILGESELCIGDTETYTIETNNTVTWGITNNGTNVTLGLTGNNGECTINAKFDMKLIGKTETLTAYLDYGATFTKTIYITSRI